MKNIVTDRQREQLENLIDEACSNGHKDDVVGVLQEFNSKDAYGVHPTDLSDVINRVQYFTTDD